MPLKVAGLALTVDDGVSWETWPADDDDSEEKKISSIFSTKMPTWTLLSVRTIGIFVVGRWFGRCRVIFEDTLIRSVFVRTHMGNVDVEILL